ncbi:hypothetical protein MLD38_039989 [Melastoma candidum]|uniref:Uncharacterized protein n=1 Tax=Melastoma candidum TaxID=119954 RepID=A0ACB9L3Y4_9MYRT|nr:hypothetical protein MLD38_039989 [Melastoma candidum]
MDGPKLCSLFFMHLLAIHDNSVLRRMLLLYLSSSYASFHSFCVLIARMKEFPSCFTEGAVQVSDASPSLRTSPSKTPRVLVTCVYLSTSTPRRCWITVTWFKMIVGHGLAVSVHRSETSMSPARCLCKVEIKPRLFSMRRGSKTVQAVELYWDFWNSNFGLGPEPVHGFYVVVVLETEVLLLLGDMKKEAWKRVKRDPPTRCDTILLSKRVNLVGKKCFLTKAQFFDVGRSYDLVIECDKATLGDHSLFIRIDDKLVMEVNRLQWNFRGNQTISVDGLQVEVYWDIHDWLFGYDSTGSNGHNTGTNGVFMFKTSYPYGDENSQRSTGTGDYDSWASVWSSSQESSGLQESGFSLILLARKNN